MASIRSQKQILTVGAGTDTAVALFEIQDSSKPTRRLVVARKSKADASVYFMDHAELTALGALSPEVISLFEDSWPNDLQPELTTSGTLPQGFNANYTQADFGDGKVGTIAFSNFDPTTGSYGKTTKYVKGVAANAGAEVGFWQKASTKFYAWAALATGALVGLILLVGRKAS